MLQLPTQTSSGTLCCEPNDLMICQESFRDRGAAALSGTVTFAEDFQASCASCNARGVVVAVLFESCRQCYVANGC